MWTSINDKYWNCLWIIIYATFTIFLFNIFWNKKLVLAFTKFGIGRVWQCKCFASVLFIRSRLPWAWGAFVISKFYFIKSLPRLYFETFIPRIKGSIEDLNSQVIVSIPNFILHSIEKLEDPSPQRLLLINSVLCGFSGMLT